MIDPATKVNVDGCKNIYDKYHVNSFDLYNGLNLFIIIFFYFTFHYMITQNTFLNLTQFIT